MPYFNIENVQINPFRDVSKYPIMQPKVDTLKESYKQTGVWPNMFARPMGNVTPDGASDPAEVQEWINQFMADTPADEIVDLEVELPFGTHRLEAMKQMGLEKVFLSLKEINNDDMLLMMIAENHSDFGGNIQTDVESIRAIWEAIHEKATEAGNLERFQQSYPAATARTWKVCAGDDGPSWRFIQSVIGKKWSQDTIVFALNVIKDVRAGLYDQAEVFQLSNIALVGEYSKLANVLFTEPDETNPKVKAAAQFFPVFYRQEVLREAIVLANAKNSLVTTRVMKQAVSAACAGKDPLVVLSKGTNPSKEWSLKVYLDKLTGAADSKLKLEEILEHDGFKDFPGLDEVIKAIEVARAKAEGGDAEGGDNDASVGGDDAQAAVDSGAAELDGATPDGEAMDAVAEDGAVEFVFTDAFTDASINLSSAVTSFSAFKGQADDLDDDAKAQVVDVFVDSLKAMASVASQYTTKTALKKAIDDAYKAG